MRKLSHYIILLSLILFGSCSVRKMIPPGEQLYNGAEIKIEKEEEVKASKNR